MMWLLSLRWLRNLNLSHISAESAIPIERRQYEIEKKSRRLASEKAF